MRLLKKTHDALKSLTRGHRGLVPYSSKNKRNSQGSFSRGGGKRPFKVSYRRTEKLPCEFLQTSFPQFKNKAMRSISFEMSNCGKVVFVCGGPSWLGCLLLSGRDCWRQLVTFSPPPGQYPCSDMAGLAPRLYSSIIKKWFFPASTANIRLGSVRELKKG